MVTITPEAVTSRWNGPGRPTEANEDSWASLLKALADASEIASYHFPDLDSRILSGDISAGIVEKILAEAVIRSLKVGYEYRLNYSEATGPFSKSAAMDATEDRRGVYLNERELKMLAPKSASRAKIGTLGIAGNSYGSAYPYYGETPDVVWEVR